ncbi:MAG: YihA family ribosome biogenesis GTP-binding protein [Nitrospinaceae bacterium]|jgi:GTP-binding protein|nr:MAG: YihA family ribosome biogenesis GTP-binding protein [Nitrospinaceae bacterium]
MKIVSTEFLTGAVSPRHYPAGVYPEFAFAGRSNVGKSSLIKSLLCRKKLVRTSATPGKTQEINFFRINHKLIFADLPGFGFAKVPRQVQKRWQHMIEQYLKNRKNLAAVIFLIDIRREPTDLDRDLKAWLDACSIPCIPVATKADKLSKTEQKKQIRKIEAAFFGETGEAVIGYSSKSSQGRKELWSEILARAENGAGSVASSVDTDA